MKKIYKAISELVSAIAETENVSVDTVLERIQLVNNGSDFKTSVQAYMEKLGPLMGSRKLLISEVDSITEHILEMFSKTEVHYLMTHITPFGYTMPDITELDDTPNNNDVFVKNLVLINEYIIRKQKRKGSENNDS